MTPTDKQKLEDVIKQVQAFNHCVRLGKTHHVEADYCDAVDMIIVAAQAYLGDATDSVPSAVSGVDEAIYIIKDIVRRREGLILVLTGMEKDQKKMENKCLETLITAAQTAETLKEENGLQRLTIEAHNDYIERLKAENKTLRTKAAVNLMAETKALREHCDYLEGELAAAQEKINYRKNVEAKEWGDVPAEGGE